MYGIGIDLGGTSIKYAIVSSEGEILVNSLIPSCANQSSEAVIAQIKIAIYELIDYAKNRQIEISGIGIGTPGIIDNAARVVLGGAENIVGWENILLADEIEHEFHLPVVIDNDGNLMSLGEHAFGAAQGCKDALFITVGTGIGGGIIINNELFRGFNNRGAEIGHIPLIANGKKCACGSIGCLEHYASTTALIKMYGNIAADGEFIVQQYLKNEPHAVHCMHEHCDYLGHGIAGLVNIFSSQKVVIGGGISEAGEFYLTLIKKYFDKYVIPTCAENTELCLAKLGNNAGFLGAAKLILKKLKYNQKRK